MHFICQCFCAWHFDPHWLANCAVSFCVSAVVKGRSVSPAKRNNRAATRDERALLMYTLLTQILVLLSHLIEMQELTDALVLEVRKLLFPASFSPGEFFAVALSVLYAKYLRVRRVTFWNRYLKYIHKQAGLWWCSIDWLDETALLLGNIFTAYLWMQWLFWIIGVV